MGTWRYTKTLLFSFLSLACIATVSSQSLEWAQRAGSYAVDFGFGICHDQAGNIYVTGQYEGTTEWKPGVSTTVKGLHDIFIAKYSPAGIMEWVTVAGAPGGDAGKGIAVDKLGNVYIVGEFDGLGPNGELDFGSGIKLKSYGINDIFVAKFNSQGKILWAKKAGGGDNDKGRALALDEAGNVYITGEIAGESYFTKPNGDVIMLNPGDRPKTDSTMKKDAFVAKYLSNGDLAWAKDFGTYKKDDEARGIKVDKQGNVYFTGYFALTADFGGGHSLTSHGQLDIFIAKLNSADGSTLWAQRCGGQYGDVGRAVAIDDENNVYITGEFSYSGNFGSVGQLDNEGKLDIFLAKYDPSGNCLWAKSAGGKLNDVGRGLAVDKFNNVYVTGGCGLSAKFSGNVLQCDSLDVFVASYAKDGSFRWYQKAGGDTADEGYAVTADNQGSVFLTGYFNKTAAFSSSSLKAMDHDEIFVAKYQEAPVAEPTTLSSSFTASALTCGSMQMSWTAGNGVGRIIIAREGADVDAIPVDGRAYNANNAFGLGDNLGNGNYVVYSGNGNSVTVTSLGSGTYYFKVFEYNGNGFNMNYTTGFAATNQAANGIALTANVSKTTLCLGESATINVTGATSYSWAPPTYLNTTSGASVVSQPTEAITYTVTAQHGGCERKMNIALKVEDCTADIKDLSLVSNLSVYPNPTRDFLRLEMNILKPSSIKIRLVNLLGEEVYSNEVNLNTGLYHNKISMDNLSSGLYLLQLESEQTLITQKIILQK